MQGSLRDNRQYCENRRSSRRCLPPKTLFAGCSHGCLFQRISVHPRAKVDALLPRTDPDLHHTRLHWSAYERIVAPVVWNPAGLSNQISQFSLPSS